MITKPDFSKHHYINLTTFRKNGKPVPTPVWFVELDGKLYVFTGAQSGKVKRIRANGRAHIAPSDARGQPLGASIPMHARLVTEPDLLQRADEHYQRKYGWQRTLFNWLNTLLGHKASPALIELVIAD